MSYESERKSLEELKQQARQQSQAAGKVVPCVTVTEKNWAALLSLQQTQLQLLEQILKAQATLATRWQMEEFLQSQTEELTDCAQKSQDQRSIFLEAVLQPEESGQSRQGAVLDLPDSHGLAGSLGSDAAYLSADLTQLLEANPKVEDSTTMRPQRRRKRALGEKPDEQDYQQKM